MICGTEKYQYFASVDGGASYVEVDTNNFPKVSQKRVKGQVFYRAESSEWEIQKYKTSIYDYILGFIQDPCTATLAIKLQIRHSDTTVLWTGDVKINEVIVDEGLGIMEIKPSTDDAYTWWDKDKDTVVIANTTYRIVKYKTTSVPFSFTVVQSSPSPPAYGGMDLCAISGGTPRILTYTQQRIPFAAPGYVQGNGIYDQFVPPEPYAEITPDPTATNCPTNLYYKAECSIETLSEQTLGNLFIRVDDLVQQLMNEFSTGLTLESTFLNDATNPVTGSANQLNNLLIGQIADAVDTEGKNKEITFTKLMSIYEKLNCVWWIEGNKLKVENIKTVDAARVGGIDLTASKYNVRKYLVLQDIEGNRTDNKYSFDIDIPKKEEFIYNEGDNRIGTIEYDSPLANDKKTTKHEHRDYMADVIKLINFPDSLSEDNYIILVTDGSYVILEESDGSVNILNWHLSWEKVLNNYWVYSRPFYTGTINGTSITFSTIQKLKKQTDLEFPDLDDIYDPDKYITTNMGDGLIESFELDTSTGFIKVTLNQTACEEP